MSARPFRWPSYGAPKDAPQIKVPPLPREPKPPKPPKPEGSAPA
jgi:hypothetical protein